MAACMGHPVLPVVGAVPHGPDSQSCRDEFTGGFRGRAAPGMPFVRHDARVCGNGPREYTCRMGEEPGRSGLVYGWAAQWRSCRVLSGMVLAEEGRLGEEKWSSGMKKQQAEREKQLPNRCRAMDVSCVFCHTGDVLKKVCN